MGQGQSRLRGVTPDRHSAGSALAAITFGYFSGVTWMSRHGKGFDPVITTPRKSMAPVCERNPARIYANMRHPNPLARRRKPFAETCVAVNAAVIRHSVSRGNISRGDIGIRLGETPRGIKLGDVDPDHAVCSAPLPHPSNDPNRHGFRYYAPDVTLAASPRWRSHGARPPHIRTLPG